MSHSGTASASVGKRLITGPENAAPAGGFELDDRRPDVPAGQGERFEGRWNPSALITAVTRAIAQARPVSPGTTGEPTGATILAGSDSDDIAKLAVISQLLGSTRLLVIFYDFEQNLTTGGGAFLDPGVADAIAGLADAAATGALLVTSRYPLPGPELFLAEIPLPPLSPAELRHMFLRLPALRDLDPGDRALSCPRSAGRRG